MPDRKYSTSSLYRYGFNGKENDNDVKGEGVQLDYGFRIYDSRLGKFLSVDPLFKSYPWYTPYQFAGNKPIACIDLDGLEEVPAYDDWKVYTDDLQYSEIRKARETALKQTTVEKIDRQPRTTFSSIFHAGMDGVRAKYREAKSGLSTQSLKKMGNDALGTAKDFGNMMIAKPGAAESFSNRVTNASVGFSNSLAEPFVFLGTMGTRTPEQNAFGVGYHLTGLTITAATFIIPEVLAEATALGPAASYEGNQIIRNAINRGVTFRIIEEAEEIRYFQTNKLQGNYGMSNNPMGTISLMKGFQRVDVMEEAIHFQQRMQFGDDFYGNSANKAFLELDAQNQLLRIGTNENWTKEVMDRIRSDKSYWEKQIKK